MRIKKLKIDALYKFVKDGSRQTIKFLGMDEDKYKFAPARSNGEQFGVANGLTEYEVSKYVQA